MTRDLYEETALVPISALQHLVFCERQCALIHLERLWVDNSLTLEGSYLHKAVDQIGPRREVRGNIATVRGLMVRSLRLGVWGRTDVVEFHLATPEKLEQSSRALEDVTVAVPGLRGRWYPFPVEYKRGKPKSSSCDVVQLCAQAISLEEMLGVQIETGSIYYGRNRRRVVVDFREQLRIETTAVAARLHELFEEKSTPKALYEKKCDSCSFLEICLPKVTGGKRAASDYVLAQLLQTTERGNE